MGTPFPRLSLALKTHFSYILSLFFPHSWSLLSTWCKAQGYGVWGRRTRVAQMAESRILSTSFLVFCYFDIKKPNCFPWPQSPWSWGEEGREVQRWRRRKTLMSLAPWKEAWKLVVVTQDGGLQLVLPGWLPGCCFPAASWARSQVIVPVEAWADSEYSGDSSTLARQKGGSDWPGQAGGLGAGHGGGRRSLRCLQVRVEELAIWCCALGSFSCDSWIIKWERQQGEPACICCFSWIFFNNWVFPVEGTRNLHCRGVTSAVLLGRGQKWLPCAPCARIRSCLVLVSLQC